MDEIVLSNQDSDAFDELLTDRKVIVDQFERSMRYHHNQLNALEKTRKKLWCHIMETYNLDVKDDYTVTYDVIKRRYVVKKEEKDDG